MIENRRVKTMKESMCQCNPVQLKQNGNKFYMLSLLFGVIRMQFSPVTRNSDSETTFRPLIVWTWCIHYKEIYFHNIHKRELWMNVAVYFSPGMLSESYHNSNGRDITIRTPKDVTHKIGDGYIMISYKGTLCQRISCSW